MAPLILYQRDDCQLCDLALEVLAQVHAPEFDSVFIDGDNALETQYGARIPVLYDIATDRALDWPFTYRSLREFLAYEPSSMP